MSSTTADEGLFVFGRYGTVQLQRTHHVPGTFTGYYLDLLWIVNRFLSICAIQIHVPAITNISQKSLKCGKKTLQSVSNSLHKTVSIVPGTRN